MTPIERKGGTQTVPDVQRGGVHEGPDVVTGLLMYGTDTVHALRPLGRAVRHYTVGSAPGQDIRIPSPFVSAQHCRLVRTRRGLRVVDQNSKNGTYFEGKRKTSFYLEPGEAFVIGARTHRVIALNDEMRAHHATLTAIVGYEDEHVLGSSMPSPGELIDAAVAGRHLLVAGEPGCDQDRLAQIVHAISLLRERPLVRLDRASAPHELLNHPALHRAATILLDLEDNPARLDPSFTSRLFCAVYQTRLIALARTAEVAAAALGERRVKEMTYVCLEPLSRRPRAIHRLLDRMFWERGSSLLFSAMTPHNQAALRRHRWAGNLASLREAADRLIAVAGQGSLRSAAQALDAAPATLHNWYANIVGLTQPLLSGGRTL